MAIANSSPTQLKNACSFPLRDLNSYLTCHICKGYLIEATTLPDCLHSFCRSCLVRSLYEEPLCPKCCQPLHQPFSTIRLDRALQGLVYKLVPGLYEREMARRKMFYNSIDPDSVKNLSPEKRGEVSSQPPIIADDEHLSIELICGSKMHKLLGLAGEKNSDTANVQPTFGVDKDCLFHLLCPASVTIANLHKLIRAKLDLVPLERFDVALFMWTDECLSPDYTLRDVAVMYSWKRVSPLRLYFAIFDLSPEALTGVEGLISGKETPQSESTCEPFTASDTPNGTERNSLGSRSSTSTDSSSTTSSSSSDSVTS